MTQYTLGRNKSSIDFRDYKLGDFIARNVEKENLTGEMVWNFPDPSLDQGQLPHCVGFSMAAFGISLPVHKNFVNKNGHEFYYKCKELDGTPGEENGSTIRTAAKAMKALGQIEGYAFAHNIKEIKWWLLNKGPIIAGTTWTSSMCAPDKNNRIHIWSMPIGGHAFLLSEYRKDNFIGIQNSWGAGWGKNGKAYISACDFAKIFLFGGEAMTAVELEE